eukprot:GHVP01020734.1.p1 GENE.GHVP01020734.1~~GHVP01020734.1.p1  ORF type:complete len:105 (+),score=6.29 GHVP01020734.1:303-617(+)
MQKRRLKLAFRRSLDDISEESVTLHDISERCEKTGWELTIAFHLPGLLMVYIFLLMSVIKRVHFLQGGFTRHLWNLKVFIMNCFLMYGWMKTSKSQNLTKLRKV